MKSKIVLVLVVLSILFAACNKSGVFNGAKINVATDFVRQYTLTYTYNADGTVAKITKSTVGDTTFAYSGNNVLQDGLSNNNPISAISYHLNSSNYADTAQGELQLRDYMATYTYDVNGQFTQQKTYTGTTVTNTDNYTNVNKNITEIEHQSSTGVITYDYFTYLSSNTNTLGVQNYGKYFLGVSTNNLVSTDIRIGSNLDTTDIITSRYRYNGSNYVDTLVSYNRAGQLVDSMAFTYY